MGDEAGEAGDGAPDRGRHTVGFGGVIGAMAKLQIEPAQHEDDGDGADDQPHRLLGDQCGRQPAKADADDGARHHVDQHLAVIYAPPCPHRDDVHQTQDRQQDGGRPYRRYGQRHQRHADETDGAAKPALGQADQNDRRNGGRVEPRIEKQA